MSEIAKPIIEQQKKSLENIKPLIDQQQALLESLKPNLVIIQKLQRQFIPIIDNGFIEEIKTWNEVKETPEFKSFYKNWHWIFRKKKVSVWDYWFGLFTQTGSDKFSEELINEFSKSSNLDKLSKDIEKKFPLRFSVIEDGLKFHLKGRFDSAVTLLLPHTEGILWELGQLKGKVVNEYNSIKEIKNGKKGQRLNLSKLSKELFDDEIFYNILIKDVFCAGPRDKILHGRNIYQNEQKEITKWFSTLLILTLWRLADEL